MLSRLEQKNIKDIVIVSATPQFLERGVLWFAKNETAIKNAIKKQFGIWNNSALVLEQGASLPPRVLARKLFDLGYEKAGIIFGKGEFSYRGNIIEIAPINRDEKITIEYYGNTIESIDERPLKNTSKKIIRTADRPFRPHDYVVHLDHGIGIFKQMTRINASEEDFFEIEYAAPRTGAKSDTLYVPISKKMKLDLYVGFETPTIHRLGGSVWFATRAKAREDIEAFAKELLSVYKKRASARKQPMHPEPNIETSFAESFQYEETDDQKKAMGEILHDLTTIHPMDRVLAGDVGFGKTEVALRVALRVIANGQRVIMLAPTTVLVEEHRRSVLERFKETAVRVEALSRLTPKHHARNIIKSFKQGTIDILIGTHRLFSKDVAAALGERVGLLIIDEEHRFGVKQKEFFKNLRADMNILSLSATPIPRTLSLALAGLRDISIIKTPPPGRIPIQTFVLPYRDALVKDAIIKELGRNGQVFFLHNRIETLGVFKKRLQNLVPKARIACIHGRSSPNELVQILKNFRKQTINVLIATTIIENGIDFPNANTLIVEDSTRLGLSEAHQLRGRIGRTDRNAYAYFLYRSKTLTKKSALRLSALQDASDLGAGYDIALRDLEIRGAGNALGRDQSGTANKVGLNLYYAMLAEAIEQEKHFN